MARRKKKNYSQLLFLGFIVLLAVTFLTGMADKYFAIGETPQATISNDEQAKQNFIKQLAPIAQAEQRQYGVLASITLAQAALESDWGKSELSAKYNNLFGIKIRTGL